MIVIGNLLVLFLIEYNIIYVHVMIYVVSST